MDCKRVFLSEKEIPTAWYNLQADLPKPVPPPLHPGTKQPIGPADLEPIFAKALIAQEVSQERWIEIPDDGAQGLRDLAAQRRWCGRRNLEKALKTPARIYFKDESHSPPGSHKPNTAVPQAYYNKKEGINRLTTETGAGQWGSALAFACSLVRHAVQGLHGQGELPAEALPPLDDAHLGRPASRPAPRTRPRPAGRSWPPIPTARAAWASPSARRSRRPSAATTPSTRSAAC